MKRCSKHIFLLVFIIGMVTVLDPLKVEAKSKLELVFIIDTSGSMGDDIAGVRSNISSFVDRLQAKGIDYNLGLIGYEQNVDIKPMTSSVYTFKNYLSSLSVSGGTENGLDALDEAMDYYTFYDNSVVYFVLIGDEEITSSNGNSESSVIQRLNSNGIKTIVIRDPGYSLNYEQFGRIADATNGLKLNINDNYSSNLDHIFDEIQKLPVVDTKLPIKNAWYGDIDGLIPTVEVTDPDSDTLNIKYYIDNSSYPSGQQTVTNSKQKQLIQLKAVDINSLSEGHHDMKVSVFDGQDTVNDIVGFNIDKSLPQINSFNVNAGTNNISIYCRAYDNRSGLVNNPYHYEIGDMVSDWVNSTNYQANDLQPNTEYTIIAQAKDNTKHIAKKEMDKCTLAEQPSISVESIKETELTIKAADNNPNYTEYQVRVDNQYVNSSGNVTSNPVWIRFNDKKLTIEKLTQGKTYTIQLKAKNKEQKETGTDTRSITMLSKCPDNVVLTPLQTSVSLRWDNVDYATGYCISIDNEEQINIGQSNTYTYNGLTPKTTHIFKIATKNVSGIGNFSQEYAVTTLPYPPVQPEIPSYVLEQTAINLEWKAVPETEYYELMVDGEIVKVEKSTSYIHKKLEPETTHTYKLRAVNRGGMSPWTNELSLITLPYPPKTPVLKMDNKTNTTIKLKWNAVDKAEGYHLKIDGIIKNIGNITEYTHSNLKALTTHTYELRAYNRGGESRWGQKVTVKTHPNPPTTPINLMTTADTDKITLSWYQVEFTEYYEVEVDGKEIIKTEERTLVHTNIKQGKEHSYRVRAINVSGKSEWSNKVFGTTLVEGEDNYSLTNLVAVVTNELITLAWDSVDNNVQYEIEVDGTIHKLGSETIFNHTGLNANEFHKYNIKVITNTGEEQWCANLALSTLPNTPDAPSSINADAYPNRIELRWDSVNGATGYEIEIDGKEVITTNDLKIEHSGLEPGTEHTYRLRAKNITGVTGWSREASVVTLNPEYNIDVIKDEEFTFTIIAQNVQDFNTALFNIGYDKTKLQIVDLYEGTLDEDSVTKGDISNTNLSLDIKNGKLIVKCNESIVPGTSWSGEIMTIKFKALKTGNASIRLNVNEKE